MSTLLDPPADDTVPDEVVEACRTIGDIHCAVLDRVARDALEPIRNAAAAAASAHAGVLERSALADPDTMPAQPGRAIGSYRGTVVAHVFAPLLEALDRAEPGAVIGAAWEEARTRLRDVVEQTPARIVCPEPAGLLRPRPEDPAALRWHKSALRTGRAAGALIADASDHIRRSLGRSVPERNDRMLRLPLRDLVAEHIDVRLPPLHAEFLEALAAQLGALVARVHGAVDPWSRTVLEAEVATDRPALHRPGEDATGPPLADAEARVEAVRGAITLLHTTLEEIAASEAAGAAASDELEALVVAEDSLVADTEVAGTPLDRGRLRTGRAERARRSIDRRLDLWSEWHRRTRASLRMTIGVLNARASSTALLAGVNDDVSAAARALSACLGATARTLRAERAELARACAACSADGGARKLREILDEAGARLPGIIDEDVVAALRGHGAIRDLNRAVDERLGALQAGIAELPDDIVVQDRETLDGPPDPAHGAVRAHPRSLISESFDVVRLERIRAAAEEAKNAFDAAVEEASQARGVIEYNLRAAASELTPDEGDEIAADAFDDARELALGGLDRAAENLERIAAESAARLRPFSDATFEAVKAGWSEVVLRLAAEDTVHEHVLDVGFRLRARAREGSTRVAKTARDWSLTGRRWSLRGIRFASRLQRMGRVALEGETMSVDERRRTLEALAGADRLVDELPLVYRRLFGLQVVADRAALEGRGQELATVRRHFRNWRSGLTDPLVISGWSGAGTSSFFEAALGVVADEGIAIRRIAFEARILDEATLVARVSAALELDQPPDSLGLLADRILAEYDREWPAVAIDNLEQLLLRTASDNGLLGPLLEFMSVTDSRIFWIVRIGRAAWQYIERVEPTAAGLVRHLDLASLARDALEKTVLGRHDRSGLPLEFEAPATPSAVLRRRLARARDESDRQAILRADFFDRLARASSPSITLALFYWLRSAHMSEDGAQLLIRPLDPLGFAFLQTLSADHTFALKAFIEHGTLSIAEHDRVVSVPRAVSREIFASLANLLLIEPADDLAHASSRAERDTLPWRLRALVLHPVLILLRSRNLA